jgi:hypothetical protein
MIFINNKFDVFLVYIENLFDLGLVLEISLVNEYNINNLEENEDPSLEGEAVFWHP